MNPINTSPIQQFIQQVKSAELSQAKEIKLDMKMAKTLVYCLAELNGRLVENYDNLLAQIQQTAAQSSTLHLDGGGFGDK